MNRFEVRLFLKSFFTGLASAPDLRGDETKPFLDLVLTLRQDLPLSIPLLRDLALVKTGKETLFLQRKIDRLYRRLCRVQEELSRLDLKKAASGTALEDFVFSQIDFSRYREMDEKDYQRLFPEGLKDFDDAFYTKNFGYQREEIQSLIEGSYVKNQGIYKIQKESPLVLSVLRTLETSLETSPLFTAEEIHEELQNLIDFIGGVEKRELLPGMKRLYPFLVSSLENVIFSHEDGMKTKLFIGSQGDLEGTFQPGGKPWTRVLIPAK